MTVIKETVTFTSDIKKVWDLVTDLSNQSWRKNIKLVEASEDHMKFREHTLDEYVTDFQVKTLDEYKRYEFTLENSNMTGSFLGTFEENEDGGCTVTFVENLEAKSATSKPFVKSYGKTQMQMYINYLKEALGEPAVEVKENPYSVFNNISLGVVLGVILGMVMDNMPVGIAIGLCCGVAITGLTRKK